MENTNDPQQLLNELFANDTDFQNCMGDYYMQWKTYIELNIPNPLTLGTLSINFNNWAILNAPTQAVCVNPLIKAFENIYS